MKTQHTKSLITLAVCAAFSSSVIAQDNADVEQKNKEKSLFIISGNWKLYQCR